MSSALSVALSAPTQAALRFASVSPSSNAAAVTGHEPRLPVVYAEPALRPDLGLVIIEFRTITGTVVNSIPTAQALERYQRSLLLHIGETGQDLGTLRLTVADRARAGPDPTPANAAQQQDTTGSAPSTVIKT